MKELTLNDTTLGSYEKTINWLIEPDRSQPGVRYFALKDLMNIPEDNPDLQKAKTANMASGPVRSILAAQKPEGYWVKPGPGYLPKYTGTVWQLIFLSQFGADGSDNRVRAACEYVLSHSISSNSVFTMTGAPSGFIHCLSGNLISALIDLNAINDHRVLKAIELQSRLIIGADIGGPSDEALRYYRSSTSGPLFVCGNNQHLPCAWGAIKALRALGKVPKALRSETMNRAIDQSVAFLLRHNPALADYPSAYGKTPSASWFKFGYPLGYMSDVLQSVEALAAVGCINDLRLTGALALIESKRNESRQWNQEYTFKSKMWAEIEKPGLPSKWVTLRALKILKTIYNWP